MSFTTGIPVNGSSLGASRDPLRANLQKLRTNSEVNHFAVNSANAGKHEFVEIPVRSGAPTTLASEASLYTKLDGNTQSQLWFTPDATGNQYQLTRGTAANFATFGDGSLPNGWTFLPGGLLLQYGTVAAPGTSGTVILPRTFSTSTYQVFFTCEGTVSTFAVTNASRTTSQFKYLINAAQTNLFWMAVGS